MPNIIRDREEDLVRAFRFALEQCAKALDSCDVACDPTPLGPPMVKIPIEFTFPNDLHICSSPEFDLSKPIPNPIPEPRAYEVGGPDDPDVTLRP